MAFHVSQQWLIECSRDERSLHGSLVRAIMQDVTLLSSKQAKKWSIKRMDKKQLNRNQKQRFQIYVKSWFKPMTM